LLIVRNFNTLGLLFLELLKNIRATGKKILRFWTHIFKMPIKATNKRL